MLHRFRTTRYIYVLYVPVDWDIELIDSELLRTENLV